MTSQAQKDAGWILPEQLTDHELLCVYMLIPNVDEYRAAFLGAIGMLSDWWNWEKSYQPGDTRASQAAQYWRKLIFDYLCISYYHPYNPKAGRKLPSDMLITMETTMSQQTKVSQADLAGGFLSDKFEVGDGLEIEITRVAGYEKIKINRLPPPSPYTIGDYKQSAQTDNHGAWLKCEGDFISKTTYPDLFEVIGYAFGTNIDPDLFKLPDFRGRTSIGVGHGDMLTPRVLGDYVGSEQITLASGEMPQHSHALKSSSGVNLLTANGATAGVLGLTATSITRNAANPVALETHEEGGSLPHPNIQPSIAIGSLFIYSGVEA